MSKEQKQELRINGFIIIEAWQIIVSLLTFVFVAGIFYAYTTNTLAQHSEDIKNINVWQGHHQSAQEVSVSYRNSKLAEIGYNTKAICEKLGIKYQVIEIQKGQE